MSETLRILVLEDRPADAELMLREVRKEGIEVTALRVESEADFRKQLQEFRPGLILADYSLPSYDGLSALAVSQRVCPDVPFILVSGTLDDEAAVACLHHGATDYIIKERVSRLGVAVRRALLDVEERKELRRAEQSLRDSEMRYRRLFESAKDGILIVDAETGMALDVNPFLTQRLGFSREEVLGKKVWELGFLKDIVANRAHFVALQETEKEYIRYEDLALETRDGRRIEVEFVSNVYLVNGHKVIQCNVRDITERKRADAALLLQSAALNAAANPMLITDRHGTISWVNAAFTVASGYTYEEAVGRNPRELVKSGVHDQAFFKGLWDTILAGSVWHGEMTNRRKDGSLYPEEQTITPVRDSRGEITHFVAVKQDLTQRRQLEAQFLQAQKMEAVGRLAGGVAHDFNNVLSVILGYSEILGQSFAKADQELGMLDEIRKGAERAAGLTKQLLAFSRKQVLQPRPLDLNDVVREMGPMLRRLIGEDIEFVTSLAEGIGQVLADEGQMQQVLMNLAVNSRDAMPGGGTLTVETSVHRPGAGTLAMNPEAGSVDRAELSVRDTGSGMDAETMGRIFEPFFTTKELGRGTGLGLATVYGIVKQSGGHIEVESAPGMGTTFRITLPKIVGAVGPPLVHSRKRSAAGGHETILLVEDDEAIRSLARKVLEGAGYTVLVATCPENAMEVLSSYSGPLDLLLTDVVMPGMGGPAFAAQLVAERPATRVVFMSGYTDDALARHGILEPGIRLLEKPFVPERLVGEVRAALDAQVRSAAGAEPNGQAPIENPGGGAPEITAPFGSKS